MPRPWQRPALSRALHWRSRPISETAGQVLAGATGEPAATPAGTEGTSKEGARRCSQAQLGGRAEGGCSGQARRQEAKPNGAAAAPPAGGGTPAATAESAEKGSLKNPYPDFASVAEEGHKKYMAAGCNGCHGGGGGGGMGPPLTNEVWVYGKDDDTLFRLIALGSDGLQKQGFIAQGLGERGRPDAGAGHDRQVRRRFVEDHSLDQVEEPLLGRRLVGFG